MELHTMATGGTGSRFGNAVIVLAGVSALIATLITLVSIWLQAKNYRKPLLQRYVVRILVMVPIYSIASWVSLISLKASVWVDPIRDVYEAFTIYTFVQLLVNFIGGERALIIMMHGRRPVAHLWPLSLVLPKVDISDPHTFLAIKRGILQYTWVKPLLAIATIIMKATNTYQEGYIGLNSGYLWSGIIYNISITVSLYALALFWVCMSADLKPFRPVPKFLSIKGIIFASYWQGFFLSILVWLGALPDDVPGYTPDNLAAAIQDALICFEMPLFAMAHWYAFSWYDYADNTISSARMPVKYALRDAFGSVDLVQDSKQTFTGRQYEYRHFDAYDNVVAHEESSSREARMREGMRYERGGKGKYWIPKPGHGAHEPLLGSSRARTMSPGRHLNNEPGLKKYGATEDLDEDPVLTPEDERLYDSARALEFGDWNYPVITAHIATREDVLYHDPSIVTSSTNRQLLQPTKAYKKRRQSRIHDIQESARTQDKNRSPSPEEGSSRSSSKGKSKQQDRPLLGKLLPHASSSSSSNSHKSQLVDLVVEDTKAEEIERVRARKEGGAAWNEAEPKHFVQTYPTNPPTETVRQGYEPREDSPTGAHNREQRHNLDEPFAVGGDEADLSGGEDFSGEQSEEARHWRKREYGDGEEEGRAGEFKKAKAKYGSFREERDVWGGEGDER